ncbi:hypothetical protein [Halococcus thailandensis]|uniref:hypothetical protein n=1 Tax=Halococcus thailandensis TaxID=335952 RepID=UPI001267FCA6|nr:hypothetical protein [Halococcus thailandensis]
MSLVPPEWVLEWSQTIGALGSVFVSLLLAILYKRQQEQLAADNKALLEVSSVEWDRDDATLKMSNFGNGVAADLSLVTLAYVDTGEHRVYSSRRSFLKREDKEGEWANTIRPEEEDIIFHGKSKIGNMAPDGHPRRWYGINFSLFIKQIASRGATEVKFIHIIKGSELSKSPCFEVVSPWTQIINPQDFGPSNSLENLPSVSFHGSDDTFTPYFRQDTISQISPWIYHKGIRIMNTIPKVDIQSRPLDASGLKPVKRVFLRAKIKEITERIRNIWLTLLTVSYLPLILTVLESLFGKK